MFHPKKREMREDGRRGRGREDWIEGTEEIERGEGRQQEGKQAVKALMTSAEHEGAHRTASLRRATPAATFVRIASV